MIFKYLISSAYQVVCFIFIKNNGFIGSESQNQGENGNVWSASLNSDNPNNAFNLNFNSKEVNVNNNERFIGIPVRPIQHSSIKFNVNYDFNF
ncbi:MAG: hypothetical protein [Wendovervirus sonii]|uniref:Tail fiber protein n=1 Tax=phage Lak_Megaphage_Sonny TaxID=3109229 RepID=A0ABZ0Z276_9CAUD|nr:MAG: hypothetical protein [phage Lak_Megaphage_Sonny]